MITSSAVPAILGGIYLLSEIGLLIRRHSGTRGGDSQDRYSLALLWIAILASCYASLWAADRWPAAFFPHHGLFCLIGLVVFIAGVVFRWWSIIVLGKYFTVDVAIASEHHIVNIGPYRFVRHPSYTGALIAFAGFGLSLGNWMSILCLMVPITVAFLWRIHVEERALIAAFGDEYRAYAQRTKRLIPFLY